VVKEPISVIGLWRGHLDHLTGEDELIGDIRDQALYRGLLCVRRDGLLERAELATGCASACNRSCMSAVKACIQALNERSSPADNERPKRASENSLNSSPVPG